MIRMEEESNDALNTASVLLDNSKNYKLRPIYKIYKGNTEKKFHTPAEERTAGSVRCLLFALMPRNSARNPLLELLPLMVWLEPLGKEFLKIDIRICIRKRGSHEESLFQVYSLKDDANGQKADQTSLLNFALN